MLILLNTRSAKSQSLPTIPFVGFVTKLNFYLILCGASVGGPWGLLLNGSAEIKESKFIANKCKCIM